jgi:sulfide dehydrogenase cytochrome subunit
MKPLPTVVAALGMLAAASAAQAADPERARNLAATCANCHGTDGRPVSRSGIDPLAGIDQGLSLQKLADFKSGPARHDHAADRQRLH